MYYQMQGTEKSRILISMDRWIGKLAVVTGASSGIGAATAKQLVEIGVNVMAIARRKKNLLRLAKELENKKGKFYAFKADITNEEEIVDVFQWININFGAIHILINSAGLMKIGTLGLNGSLQLWSEVFNTNVLGLCVTTREAIQNMHAYHVDGHIIHVNSIFGHKIGNVPLVNVYPASKHAVTALTETLRKEFIAIKSNIKISSISPGLVDTDIFAQSFSLAGNAGELVGNVMKSLTSLPILKSSDVADAIMFILSTAPHVQVHELILKPLHESE